MDNRKNISPEIPEKIKPSLRILINYLNEVDFPEAEVLKIFSQFNYQTAEKTLIELNLALKKLKNNNLFNLDNVKKIVKDINQPWKQVTELLEAELQKERQKVFRVEVAVYTENNPSTLYRNRQSNSQEFEEKYLIPVRHRR